jgi:hypothetical protein
MPGARNNAASLERIRDLPLNKERGSETGCKEPPPNLDYRDLS